MFLEFFSYVFLNLTLNTHKIQNDYLRLPTRFLRNQEYMPFRDSSWLFLYAGSHYFLWLLHPETDRTICSVSSWVRRTSWQTLWVDAPNPERVSSMWFYSVSIQSRYKIYHPLPILCFLMWFSLEHILKLHFPYCGRGAFKYCLMTSLHQVSSKALRSAPLWNSRENWAPQCKPFWMTELTNR